MRRHAPLASLPRRKILAGSDLDASEVICVAGSLTEQIYGDNKDDSCRQHMWLDAMNMDKCISRYVRRILPKA